MARTQADRDDDLAIGRELERKDSEIDRLRAENERLIETLRRIRLHAPLIRLAPERRHVQSLLAAVLGPEPQSRS